MMSDISRWKIPHIELIGPCGFGASLQSPTKIEAMHMAGEAFVGGYHLSRKCSIRLTMLNYQY
jgi:hypothetical protein